MLRETIAVTRRLRDLNKYIDKSKKIDSWVDAYLDDSRVNNKSLTFITPWSLSPRFQKRYVEHGGFFPTTAETNLFCKEIPNLWEVFNQNGFTIDWWITFSGAYLDTRQLDEKLESEYMFMIQNIIDTFNTPVACLNWEKDILRKRHEPNTMLFESEMFKKIISKEMYSFELERWKKWVSEEDLNISAEELEYQTVYQIACEAEEGRFLMEDNQNPLCKPGQFLFLPLGRPERYVFFSSIAQGFEKRIVSVLKQYPWRI